MDMYYKSQINAAYNLIYIGHFPAARTLLRQVRDSVTQQMLLSERDSKTIESTSSCCLQDMDNSKNQKVCSHSDNAKYRSAVVLLRMCRAARVFAKRVEKAAAHLGRATAAAAENSLPKPHTSNAPASTTSSPKTVDDYARIRLVQDQSSSMDLLGLMVS
jgi:hypothetical protein